LSHRNNNKAVDIILGYNRLIISACFNNAYDMRNTISFPPHDTTKYIILNIVARTEKYLHYK